MGRGIELDEDEALDRLVFHSKNNSFTIRFSDNCGCYTCTKKFKPSLIVSWCDEGETALCPNCNSKTVVPDSISEVTVAVLREIKKKLKNT